MPKWRTRKVYQATGMLVVVRSVDRRPNAQVPLNQPVAQTADRVSQLIGTITPLSASPVFVFAFTDLTNRLPSC